MRNKMLVAFFITVISIVFLSNDSFGGWTQPKGGMYNQVSYSYYITKKKFTTIKFDANKAVSGWGGGIAKSESSKFTARDATYYGEYGVTNKITVFTSIPFWKETMSKDIIRYAGERGPSGIGDVNLGIKHKLSDNFLKGPLSFQATVKIPEGYKYGDPLKALSLGDGQYDLTLELFWGRAPVLAGKGYAWLLPGYKFRFENDKFYSFKPSDQIKLAAGGGYPISSKAVIRWLIDWTKSVGNAEVSRELIIENYKYAGKAEQGDHVLIRDTLGLEFDALSAGLSFVYKVSQKSDLVISYNETLEGMGIFETKDAALGKTWSVALTYSF
ncbi:MAG: hypothetical protein HY752_04510 [Nitrospirae bacterium]|nr:hypothetical protein [Nitrospirota bacterium]